MENANGKKRLEGSLDDIRFWSSLLVDIWGARAKEKDVNYDSALRTVSYEIPIAGNPRAEKSVKMTVVEDSRVGKGSIQIDSGGEMLAWQAKVETICSCCVHFDGDLAGALLCNKWAHPSKHKKVCDYYRYKEVVR